MTPKAQRSLIIIVLIMIFSIATFLTLKALNDNIVFFFSPSETLKRFKSGNESQKIRVGGLVVKNSLKQQGEVIDFEITDEKNKIKILYKGILPDLFREGQGVVVEGYFKENSLQATEVLAKHDENYMPREVSNILKKEGNWKGD